MKTLALSLSPSSGSFTGIGKFAESGANGATQFTNIISAAIGVMTIVAIIWFVFIFITGAISIIGSGGDKQALESARKKITTGAIGLIIVILAIVLINLVGRFVGISNILDIGGLLNLIK